MMYQIRTYSIKYTYVRTTVLDHTFTINYAMHVCTYICTYVYAHAFRFIRYTLYVRMLPQQQNHKEQAHLNNENVRVYKSII